MQMAAEEALGARIKRLREAKRLTQAEVAEAAGVPLGTLRNWEQGTREPLAGSMPRIARALGVSMNALYGVGEE